MTQMVTRCPKCATAFRITSTQLESAKGAVRCGSCLHIFKAQDYLVKSATPESAVVIETKTQKIESVKIESPKPVTAKAEQLTLDSMQNPEKTTEIKPATSAASIAFDPIATTPTIATLKPFIVEPEQPAITKPVIDKAKVLEDEEDVLISDDMDQATEKAGYEFDGFIDIDMHPKQTVSLFEREIRYEPPRDEDEELEDESWAEDLLDDDEETLHQLRKPLPPFAATSPTVAEDQVESDEDNLSIENNLAITEAETHTQIATPYSGPVFSLVSEHSEDISTRLNSSH